MRLFVDGVEGGMVLWGTAGLLYGSGVVYGSAMTGTPSADFMTTDINVRDNFGEVVIGNSYDGRFPGFIKMDNLRFSMQPRSPTSIAGTNYDLNYNSNLDAVSPVTQDALTIGLFDFDKINESTEFLSNLLGEYTPLFTVDINVDDGFGKIIDNTRAKELMRTIIERLKPAHTNILTKFVQDQ
jgi:hypothetical protein